MENYTHFILPTLYVFNWACGVIDFLYERDDMKRGHERIALPLALSGLYLPIKFITYVINLYSNETD